eukprot:TRINITY_DN7115_c0_g1_i1.p1 TRINITY_DN7115_c0_g1~~TRINITY_DN7115_c0_g1_i1.p1  ORF type:complete len:449 (+),score=103.96 TRINITY_DN7115_c0_g1_i1:141-1487(+)
MKHRDTLKTSSEQISAVISILKAKYKAEEINFDACAILVASIFDNLESQNAVYKKEALKLVELISAALSSELQQLLPKVVASLAKPLKDKDGSVRDACVDTFGAIAANVQPPPTQGKDQLSVYFKPLFALVSDPDKNNQAAAVMAIGNVLKNSETENVIPYISRIITNFHKLLLHSGCQSKAQILTALSFLIEKVCESDRIAPHLPILVSVLKESFVSSDWTVRKASCECFQKLAMVSEAVQYSDEITKLLEDKKIDKIKPVRDAITETLTAFRTAHLLFKSASPLGSPLATRASSTVTNQGRNRSYTSPALFRADSLPARMNSTLASTASKRSILNEWTSTTTTRKAKTPPLQVNKPQPEPIAEQKPQKSEDTPEEKSITPEPVEITAEQPLTLKTIHEQLLQLTQTFEAASEEIRTGMDSLAKRLESVEVRLERLEATRDPHSSDQ